MMSIIDVFNICVEACGLGRTIITFGSVLLFYVISLITLIVVFKVMLSNILAIIRKDVEEETI